MRRASYLVEGPDGQVGNLTLDRAFHTSHFLRRTHSLGVAGLLEGPRRHHLDVVLETSGGVFRDG